MKGKLLVIGFGPGSAEHITKRALDAIDESEVIIGYTTYVDLIQKLLTDQEIVSTGMTEEVSRAREAVRQAEMGKKVAVISSGDAGVYGMAGLIYEVLVEKGWTEADGVEVEVIPGISAINSCAALLGAPVMHDACIISLSDHLTPWDKIAKRIDAAGDADFVVALYNPKSGRRTRQIEEAQKILLQYRSPDTPVGIVKSAYRDRQHIELTTLQNMLDCEIGMLSTVIIGNSTTFVHDGKMITPRGYERKYTLSSDEQPLKLHQRLQKEHEPWSLNAREAEQNAQELEQKKTSRTPYEWASEALEQVSKRVSPSQGGGLAHAAGLQSALNDEPSEMPIFECSVSPGVANKKFTSKQLLILAEVAAESGEIEYTPHHQIILRIPTDDPSQLVARLRQEGFLLMPTGDVVQIKACDFCNGEKQDAIPHAEELHRLLGGSQVPKELKIGINGCGMACYGAVNDDIGLIYRQGKFDLFLGAKTVGRTAHPGVSVREGIAPEEIVPMVERIVNRFRQEGFVNERFHKFFKRKGILEGIAYREYSAPEIAEAVCGD